MADDDKAIIYTEPGPGVVSSEDDGFPSAARRAYSDMSHYLRILQGLNKQRQMGLLCDVTLIVGDTEFPCHRNVLAACSPYFMAMFTGDMRERNESRISIEGVEAPVMKQLIEYTYTSEISIDTDNAQQLLSAANMMQVASIIDACCTFLEKEMDPTNCLGIHCFAEAHACTPLSEKARVYAIRHFAEVALHEEAKQLPQNKLQEFVSDDDLAVPSEDVVLQLVLEWVRADAPARRDALPEVLRHVRLPLVDPYFLIDQVDVEPLLTASAECRALIDEAKKFFILKDRQMELQTTRTRRRSAQQLFPLVITIGGEIYNKNYLSSVDCYSVELAQWSRLGDMPFPRCHHGAALLEGATVYIAGGFSKEKVVLNSAMRYEPTLDKWTRVANMNTPRARMGMVVLDGYVYAVGGYDGLTRIDSVERYSPRRDAWELVAPLPVPLSRCQAAALNGYLYVAGGTTEPMNHCTDQFLKYNPRTNTWTSLTKMPVARCVGGLVAAQGYLYAVGGTEEMIRASRRLSRYHPASDTWVDLAPMVDQRFDAGVVSVGSKLLVLSGHDGANSFYNTVEEYDAQRDAWTVLSCTVLPYGRCRFGCVALSMPDMRNPAKS